MKQLISNGPSKAYKYHVISRFIDDLCAMNVVSEFLASFKNIYLKKLQLKVEHHETITHF